MTHYDLYRRSLRSAASQSHTAPDTAPLCNVLSIDLRQDEKQDRSEGTHSCKCRSDPSRHGEFVTVNRRFLLLRPLRRGCTAMSNVMYSCRGYRPPRLVMVIFSFYRPPPTPLPRVKRSGPRVAIDYALRAGADPHNNGTYGGDLLFYNLRWKPSLRGIQGC